MLTFIYRCPVTGRNVQGLIPDHAPHPPQKSGMVYESVTCAACAGVHLVDPKSRKVLGVDDE